MSRSPFRSLDDRLTTGGGGRGGLPPQPFGGGGGGGRGDGDDTPSELQRLKRYRMGLYFMIGTIVMLFTSFTTLFIARRMSGRYEPMTGHFTTDWVSTPLPIKLLLINTVILLLSSLAAEAARRSAILETILIPASRIPGIAPIPERSLMWIKLAAVLGFGFLCGQGFVWYQLRQEQLAMDNPLSSAFIMMLTGGHAIHVLGGLVVLLYLCMSKKFRRSIDSRRIAVDLTAWYWHFMGAMWLYVFVVVAFIH